jgi:hypothetical protein
MISFVIYIFLLPGTAAAFSVSLKTPLPFRELCTCCEKNHSLLIRFRNTLPDRTSVSAGAAVTLQSAPYLSPPKKRKQRHIHAPLL